MDSEQIYPLNLYFYIITLTPTIPYSSHVSLHPYISDDTFTVTHLVDENGELIYCNITVIFHGHCVSILGLYARFYINTRHARRRSIDLPGHRHMAETRRRPREVASWFSRPIRTRRALPPPRDLHGQIWWNLRILQIFTSALSARQSRRSWLKITLQLYTFLSADAFLITPTTIMQRANPQRRRLYSWRQDKRASAVAGRVSRRSLQVKNDCLVDCGNESLADRIARKSRHGARPGRRVSFINCARAPASHWLLSGAS